MLNEVSPRRKDRGPAESTCATTTSLRADIDPGQERRDATPQSGEVAALGDGHRATDAGNAQRFYERYGKIVRYAPQWGKWLIYSKGVWRIDDGDVRVSALAQVVATRLFRDAAKEDDPDRRKAAWSWANQTERASSIAAMIRLARPWVCIDVDDLDVDPWLFNVRNGTVDLRTGELRDHNPDDLLTMQAPVAYDPDARAPLWEKCVERWQPDSDRRAFLQRAVGTGLTGKAIERFFINLGDGGNGKSKFFDAIGNVLGPYYAVPHDSLLVVKNHEPHDTVKAKLFRTRMVVGDETEQGAKLADAKIKALTGGGTIEARRLFENEFKFMQTWTMFMHTNHRPQVRDLTDGMWRRVRLIGWDVKIPEAEQDGELLAKLAAEAPGILNWLIEGCLAYQRHGWDEPESVRVATAAWRSDEDTFARWLDDCTKQGPTYYATAADLHDSYSAWCSTTGAEVMSKKAFGVELKKRFDGDRVRVKGKLTRVWLGVKLVESSEPSFDEDRFASMSEEAFGKGAGQGDV